MAVEPSDTVVSVPGTFESRVCETTESAHRLDRWNETFWRLRRAAERLLPQHGFDDQVEFRYVSVAYLDGLTAEEFR